MIYQLYEINHKWFIVRYCRVTRKYSVRDRSGLFHYARSAYDALINCKEPIWFDSANNAAAWARKEDNRTLPVIMMI